MKNKKLFTCIKCNQTKKRKYIGFSVIRSGGKIEATCSICVKLPIEAINQ
jgi:transcription elongation factor Elf1